MASDVNEANPAVNVDDRYDLDLDDKADEEVRSKSTIGFINDTLKNYVIEVKDMRSIIIISTQNMVIGMNRSDSM